MKIKTIPAIKSAIILVLAALAVYQVSRLWLVELVDGNFFLYLQARFPNAVPDGQSAFTRPYRIVRGNGDVFEIRYSGIAASDEWAFGQNALRSVLRSGVFVDEPNVPPLKIISGRPVLVYEYAFDMCVETFAKALGRRNADLFTNAGIETFNTIAIRPPDPQMPEPILNLWVISDARIWHFFLPNAVGYEFEIREPNPFTLNFTASENGFVPQIPHGGFVYNRIRAENPFRDPQGLFRVSYIRNRVEPFFDNPSAIVPSMREVYTFTTRTTMVRYLENAVLEYTSFRTLGRTAQSYLMADFSAALAFIASDPHIANQEVFLRNHEPRGRGHIFFFDYVIDNRPLVLTETWPTGQNCNDPLLSPVEITVEYGRVTRYRRLAYTFHIAEPARKNPTPPDEFFSLGFPISGSPEIELSVLLLGE
ncbi:MAG: hypothetical protein FWC70_01140 [Defluviitaleaceae bacterium]|nr:hypothetical protein [Defluviitaleaceae bacterium]